MTTHFIRSFVLAILFLAPVVSTDDTHVDRRWLDKLAEVDRTLIEENIGYAPPAMPTDLKWLSGEAQTWEDLRGKVVLVQSWTVKTSTGRGAPIRSNRAMKALESPDVVVIALHTPEGADSAKMFVEKRDMNMPVLLDTSGLFCDEFGFYKRPTNVVIDRNGTIRFAGLNARGITEGVKLLLEEEFDESKKPQARPEPDPVSDNNVQKVEFPEFGGQVRSARDLRGRQAPPMPTPQWLNGTPNAAGKVTVVDFWATWCGPCVRAIPHMNELAARFRNDVVCVGLSNESAGTVQSFLRKTSMNYYVAVDPSSRLQNGFGITGIPHVAVMSSDWVVRWQGHAASLTPQVLQQIVNANRALTEAAGSGSRYRWSGDK